MSLVPCTDEGFVVARLGAKPGKMAIEARVVRADGSAVSLGRAFGPYFCENPQRSGQRPQLTRVWPGV